MLDQRLKEYATDRQSEVFDAVVAHGSNNKAAAALGVSRQTVDKCINRLKKVAATHGYSPDHGMTHSVPDGLKLRGTSQLWKDGEVANG